MCSDLKLFGSPGMGMDPQCKLRNVEGLGGGGDGGVCTGSQAKTVSC